MQRFATSEQESARPAKRMKESGVLWQTSYARGL